MKRKYLPASHIIKAYYTPYIRMPTFNKKKDKWAVDLNIEFSKEKIKMARKYLRKCYIP